MKAKSSARADASLQEVLKRLGRQKVRCLDTETSGTDARYNHVVGYILAFSGNPNDSYYVPFRHVGEANVGGQAGPTTATGWNGKLAPGEQELLDAIDQPGTLCFGHRLSFDLRFMWILGMRKLLPRFEDTLINAALLDEWQPNYTLSYCCQQAGVAAKKEETIKQHTKARFPAEVDLDAKKGPRHAMAHFWRLPGDDPIAIEYATGDGTSTWQLRDWQMTQIAKPLDRPNLPDYMQTLVRVHDVESRLIPVLARMSGVGIKIDEEYLDTMLADENTPGSVANRLETLQQEFPEGFNHRSPKDVQKWCEQHGAIDWPFTPGRVDKATGNRVPAPSFPTEWLKLRPETNKISIVRKTLTLRDTFMRPMKETHLWKGRVHTVYHQLGDGEFGTPTGRLSASEPNLQAVTKHDWEVGKLHRRLFIPDAGKIWANADYSQIEPRLLAYYAGIKVLLDGFKAEPYVDAHTSVSAQMNSNWENMTKDERKKYRDKYGKRINQTVLTGGGRTPLVQKYGMAEDEVDDALKKYHKAMPELKPWQRETIRAIKRNGYVVTLLGRRCRIGPDGRDYIAPNRLLQGGNADIIKQKTVEIDEYLASVGRPIDLLNEIHDDLAFQFDEANRAVYNQCLKIATNFGPGQLIELPLPMVVDVGEGKNWAEATYGGH